MKRVFVILLLSTMTVCAYSRTDGNGSSYKGYAGKLSASIGADNETGVRSDITTSHGYSFGQGLWLGGGIGIIFAEDTSFPVFRKSNILSQVKK